MWVDRARHSGIWAERGAELTTDEERLFVLLVQKRALGVLQAPRLRRGSLLISNRAHTALDAAHTGAAHIAQQLHSDALGRAMTRSGRAPASIACELDSLTLVRTAHAWRITFAVESRTAGAIGTEFGYSMSRLRGPPYAYRLAASQRHRDRL